MPRKYDLSKLALVLASAWLLAGCASLAPANPSPPQAIPAPAGWQAPLPHQGQAADLQRWWQQFNDPLLDELLANAQAVSPDLASAQTRIAQARAARVAATSAGMPAVDASAQLLRGQSDLSQPVATSAGLALQGRWELDLFGAQAAGRDAAQANLESAQAGWHQARVSVAAETTSTYVALRACQLQYLTQRADLESRQRTLATATLAERAGLRASGDLALLRAATAEAESRLTDRRVQCESLIKSLVALTGIEESPFKARLGTEPGVVPKPAGLQVPQVPAMALRQRPDLYRAEREWLARAADVVQAEAARRPSISLSGSIGLSRISIGSFSTDGSVWTLGPLAVSLPVFDAGRRVATRDAAMVALDEARVRYLATLREAVREVEDALLQLDGLVQRREQTARALAGYEAALVATEARERAGLASTLDLEDARRLTLQARQSMIELERAQTQAWITLYRALGGGWNPENLQ